MSPISGWMAVVLWVFAVVGVGAVACVIVAMCKTSPPPPPRRRLEPTPVPVKPSSAPASARPRPAAPPPPRLTPEEREAKGSQDHERLVEQYRGLIDELYDFGERAIVRLEDQM